MNLNRPKGSKQVTENQVKEFLIKELQIDPLLYHKDMILTSIKGMNEERYLALLEKISKHFEKPMERPSLWNVVFSPVRIRNCMNKAGKLWG
jgi:hypothetical protein